MKGLSKPFSPDNIAEIQRLELALESAGIGTWELDFENNTMLWCKRTKALFGVSGEDILPYNKVLEMIHPDDRHSFEQVLNQTLQNPSEDFFSVEFRAVNPGNNQISWLLCRGQMSIDPQTGTARFLGTFIDITKDIQSRRKITEGENKSRIFQTMVEQAPMAIGLLNTRDMIIEIGNDRIFEVWGKDKSVTGMRLIDALPEIKDQVFMQLLENVYDTGVPYFGNGVLAKLECKGILKDVYFDFVYTPLRDHSDEITGIMVLATEVTEQFMARKDLEASEAKFRSLIEEAPVAICLFTGPDMTVELANQPMVGYWGKDMSVIGKPLSEAIPELEGQPFHQILNDVFTSGKTYSSKNALVLLEVDGVLGNYYFDFTYKPLFNNAGEVYAIINMSMDVTKQVLAKKALEESEAKLRSVIASAPAAIGLFVGRDLIVEMPNQAFIDIVGKGPDVVGKPLREVMPELENQAFLQILDDVYTSGVMFQSFGTQVNIVQNGVMSHNYYNITYTPILDNDGKVYAILDIAIDVTDRVIAEKQIKESQIQLLGLFEQSPVAIAIINKDNLTITMANPFFGVLVGRKPEDVIGKSLLDAIPELADQGFDQLINQVISTGTPFVSHEQAVDIVYNGQLQTIYIDLTYQPQRDMDDNIIGVLTVATDVTQQVLARYKIQEAESSLRGAVEMANLGTWQIDLTTGLLDFSERLKGWFGIEDEIITIDKAYKPIREADRPLIIAAMSNAIAPGTDGIYDAEYTIEATKTSRERILHAQGKTFYNEKGEPVKILGTVQDVTAQRKTQLALELLVQERTEELESMNEELASINEEYMATNEELAESNNLLLQSNENLQRFAYVASHDLQEPLRKIQSFGNLLSSRYGDKLGGGNDYLTRMQSSASRMSYLIEDLLAFSRISSKKDNTENVSLTAVVNRVINDLELVVQESEAVITIDDLPIIQGDKLQLGQLFQNLISNALKFRKKDVAPAIKISCQTISSIDLPQSLHPNRISSNYYQINVSDNGIGFEQKYADRIFQLFQRLHGRSEYSGTGIGLAICERVATNHGGAITVNSSLGEGTTFSVFLPF